MLFNSYIFIFLFLPITLIGYFLINKTKKYQISNLFLIVMSLWFYGYFNPSYLAVIGGSIVVNFLHAAAINHLLVKEANAPKSSSDAERKNSASTAVLIFGIVLNVAVIFYFKYYDFFIENINALFGSSFVLRNVVLPLGISFFTFQQISYLVDTWRGETKDYTFIEYALFVCYFPQLIAGPIVLHSEMVPQFRDEKKRVFQSDNFARGLYIFAFGLFKKVLIADTFGLGADWGFGTIGSLSGADALLVSLCYTFQIYFDFSGYCDMAVGIGAMMNITLPQNFNSPYKATSIVDFWGRWHMSLTRFLRQYIYFPLGGSKKGTVRTYRNIMIVFLISGIWHGANWTFILWGVLHGALQCVNRFFKKQWEALPRVLTWLVTFILVDLLWVIFRADNITDAMRLIGTIFSPSAWKDGGISVALIGQYDLIEFMLVEGKITFLQQLTNAVSGFHLLMLLAVAFVIVLAAKNAGELKFRPTWWRSVVAVVCIVWSVMSLSGVSTFLYFNF